jgi:hypothetical protein
MRMDVGTMLSALANTSWYPIFASKTMLTGEPNDEREQERLDVVHHWYRVTLKGELFRAPITANPQKVLDIGTGTGIWAIDFAE